MINESSASGLVSTTINRAWKRKITIFAVVLFGLGLYGLFDASYAYPRRGYRAAESLEADYLKYMQDSGRLDNKSASIDDPVALFDRTENVASGADAQAHKWLTQLKYLNLLSPEHTKLPRTDFFKDGVSKGGPITDAASRLDALRQAPHAEPLESYDIPVQWLICAIGLGWGLYLVVLMVRVGSRVYTWDPSEKRLTLPGGGSFTPADILEFDKRKWHKFFVTITMKQGHATLGGKAIELDLLRFVPLEDWVLEMERIAFPEDAAESAGQPETASEGTA